MLTVILLVNDGDFGPIKEGHDVLKGGIEKMLRRIQIYREFPDVRFEVQSGFQMGYVEGVAYGVDVGAEQRVRRSENGVDAVLDLIACWNDKHINLVRV